MSTPQQIRPTSPCPKAWSELDGDATRRHCSSCDLHVVNLSAMTQPDAKRFLAETRGRRCIAIAQDAAGNTIHRPVRPRRWRQLVAALVPALLAPLLPSCRPDPVFELPEVDETNAVHYAPMDLVPNTDTELTDEQLEALMTLMGYMAD